MCENYVDGYRKSLEDRERMVMWESTSTNFQHEDKNLVATVEPSELQGPPGSSLLWSVTWAKVL